jgi:hypothetical protein
MAATFFDPAHRDALLARFARVAADTPARWGSMDAPRMVAHLADALRMTLGDLECRSKPGPFRIPALRWLIIRALPWPKGTPTAPELLARAPEEWEREVAELRALAARVAERGPAGPFGTHPAFGDMPGPLVGHLLARHMDHHLRQFGA